jgi:lactoylglutathione lyase
LKIVETHIKVRDLDESRHFYENILEMKLARLELDRRVCFYWAGDENDRQLFGIWETFSEITNQHFAFKANFNSMKEINQWLKDKGVRTYNFFNSEIHDVHDFTVFSWMPAISFFFDDPNGHQLEFVSMIPEASPKAELGTITWKDWISKQTRATI